MAFPRADGERAKLSADDFRGPDACAVCHPRHYQEWRGSAHAYSAVDPIVKAASHRALKETGGRIAGFCVNCHVPAGARTGELSPSFEIGEVSPLAARGVSCEICHKMEPPGEGKPIANASFEMAGGNVIYGRLRNPAATPAHETVTSEYIGKSELCGSCHDVIHDSALIEKSFAQWSGSIHSRRMDPCQNCHMLEYSGQAAVDGPFRETLHRHNFPAVSIPLTRFPNRGYQMEQVKEFLRTAARMSVTVPAAVIAGAQLSFTVRVKNSGAGHNLPTGIANERQMWIEATVLDAVGNVLFQSGGLDANGDLMDHHSAINPRGDPALALFSDRFLNEKGEEVPFVWLASGVDERSLKPLEERGVVYRVPIDALLVETKIRVHVRLLFRSFPPYALRDLGLAELVKEVPVWEMDSFASDPVRVVEYLPRKTEYHVPGEFPAIQTAIDALQDGDRIVVAPGEQGLERPVDFRGKAIHLASAGGPEKTVLRFAGALARKEGSVVIFQSGEGPESKLEGFTIAGGRGTEVDGVRKGGGIYILRSSPSILGNKVTACESRGGLGGGVYAEGGSPAFRGNEVSSCRAERGGGFAFLQCGGPGVLLERGSVQGNVAEEGGGLYLAGGTKARLERMEVAGNAARKEGGGLYADGSASWEMRHGTIVFNRSASGPGAFHSSPEHGARVSSSIFWSNDPPGGAASFSYCILDAEPAGLTNRRAFPLFTDPTGNWHEREEKWTRGDYRLLFGSPAIDAGDPSSPPDPDDSRADMGAHFFEQPLKAFVRGDVGGDGRVKPDDLGLLFRHLVFRDKVPCLDAADENDDARLDAADAVSLAVFLLMGQLAPAPPFPDCGIDPTPRDGVTCDRKAQPCLGLPQ